MKWDNDIAEIEKYLENASLPKQPVKLNGWTTIVNVALFVESSLAVAKSNNGKKTFLPYLNRLKEFITIVKPNREDTLKNKQNG